VKESFMEAMATSLASVVSLRSPQLALARVAFQGLWVEMGLYSAMIT
jgi:hypothetical protein